MDFLVSNNRGRPFLAIQVSTEISHRDRVRRELDPLIAAARNFGIKENLTISLSHEQRFEEEGVTVHAIPAWRWLLAKEGQAGAS